MRPVIVLLCAVGVLAMVFIGHASTGPIPLNCNRACLENLVDQYLTALVAHDPKRLPLSRDLMYTENDQVIEIGDGSWKTIEGRGNYTHIFADPEFGQVAYMGTCFLQWIACLSSSWATTLSSRTFMTGAMPSSIRNGASCGLTPCSTRERLIRASYRTVSRTRSGDSTGRRAF